MRKVVLGLILSLVLIFNVNAQKTVLRGTVTDIKTGETIVGASVFLKGTTIGAMSDFDGNFELKNISPGSYALKCSFISYEPQEKEFVISANDELNIDFKLGEAVVQVEEVKVVARANRENETMLLMDQKEAEGIKESIGAQRLSNLGVSDAASATSKISGVTKNEGSGDIYIRGLGDRYLSTTMNGLPIPSDNVEKKNIDLNLFSTDVIQNVGISKTYSSASYGDQSSGQVDIVSKTFTDKTEIELSAGSNTNLYQNDVFGNFRTTQNMNNTILGYYSGSETLEKSVTNESWNTLDYRFPLNRGFSILGGKQFNLPDYDELTVFATLSRDNSFSHHQGIFKKYRGYVLDRSFTDAEKYQTSINTTGLLNVHYKIDNDNSININTLYVNKTTDELYEQGRNGEGYYYDQIPQDTATFMRDQNIKQTSILVNQLLGRHELSDKNTLKWAVGANFVSANEPNRIRNKVIMLEEDKVFFVRRTYFEQSKSYQNINDFETNGYVNDQIRFLDDEQKKFKIDYGLNVRFKTRDFSSLKRALTSRETATSIDGLDAVLLNQDLYDQGLLDYQDQAREDTYNAILGVAAGYLNTGFKSEKISGNLGLRYEFDMLDVDWDV
ncbi:MAG TPA: TonB-dependent receptor, partial [Prolixibacteraceae bacterium]|nr:TonB-dependent receptor [Prolixibacteraceae bacterium]